MSDDTVLHIATAEAIMEYEKGGEKSGEIPSESDEKPSEKGEPPYRLLMGMARWYKESMNDMVGRAPGRTTMATTGLLRPSTPHGFMIPFNDKGGGCGAAMRAMCIGMYYPTQERLEQLIGLAVEAGRMTHNNPIGYLGSLASALFASYAIQGKPLQSWGKELVDTLPMAFSYIEKVGRDVEENRQAWSYFERAWVGYLRQRGLSDGLSEPTFPDDYDVDKRDAFYKSVSYSGWGGASGHDAPMIAYDALLGCHGDWEELSSRGFFHGGDSDSTAAIVGCWFGLLHGFHSVPLNNYKDLEYRDRLEGLAEGIYNVVSDSLSA